MKHFVVFGQIFNSNEQNKMLINGQIKQRPGSKSSSQRKVHNHKQKNAFKIKCQSKCHQTIYSNRADLTLVALQTFMFDCPSRTKKLSTDGEKLRLTISNCSQLLRTDCRPNCRVNVLYTTRVKCTAENGPTHVVVRAAVTVDS